MKIAVCVKQVPDTAAVIRLAGPTAIDRTVKFILNPYDELAVEEALRTREKTGAGEVVLFTLGTAAAEATLRAGLAMGADRAVHVVTEAALPDPRYTARALAAAIREDGPPDLVFTGMRAIDTEGWQVPYRLAAALGWPAVNGIVKFERADGHATVARENARGDLEVLRTPLPAVLGAARGLNQPRYPKLPDIMGAKKKPVKAVPAAALAGVAPDPGVDLVGYELPPAKPPAKLIPGDPDAAARELVRLLREDAKVLS